MANKKRRRPQHVPVPVRRKEKQLMAGPMGMLQEALSVAEITQTLPQEAVMTEFDQRFQESIEFDGEHALLLRSALAEAYGVRVNHLLFEDATEEGLLGRAQLLIAKATILVLAFVDDDGGMPSFSDGSHTFVVPTVVVIPEPQRLLCFPVVYEPSAAASRLIPPLIFSSSSKPVFALNAGIDYEKDTGEHSNPIIAYDQSLSRASAPMIVAALEYLRTPASANTVVHELNFAASAIETADNE